MDEFKDDEAPTKSDRKEQRAAALVKNWWACSKTDRAWIENLAESLAKKEEEQPTKPKPKNPLLVLGKKKK